MSSKLLVVVKIGGSIADTADALAEDIASLSPDYGFVVVHGGASQTTALSKRLGVEPKFITSPSGVKSRYTDAQAIEIYSLAVRGQVNARLVLALQSRGVNAVGLCGIDGRLLCARQKIVTTVEPSGKQRVLRDDYTGKIENVNAGLLRLLLTAGYTPVVAPLALSESGLERQVAVALNTDGDRSAAAIAAALRAETLLLMTDVDGYFENFPHDMVPRMPRARLPAAVEKATGGMKRKLMACGEALDGGVARAVLANGTRPNPVRAALQGGGTWLTTSDSP